MFIKNSVIFLLLVIIVFLLSFKHTNASINPTSDKVYLYENWTRVADSSWFHIPYFSQCKNGICYMAQGYSFTLYKIDNLNDELLKRIAEYKECTSECDDLLNSLKNNFESNAIKSINVKVPTSPEFKLNNSENEYIGTFSRKKIQILDLNRGHFYTIPDNLAILLEIDYYFPLILVPVILIISPFFANMYVKRQKNKKLWS